MSGEFLWYIPNDVKAGHRGDVADARAGTLDSLTEQAQAIEAAGWGGALIGTGWGRPDTFTVGAMLAARTTRFQPLIAIRPAIGSRRRSPARAATLDSFRAAAPASISFPVATASPRMATVRGDATQRYAARPRVHAAGPTALDRGGRHLHR